MKRAHAGPTQESIAALESVLSDLVAVHQELLSLVRDHRRAISRADAAAIQECLSRQGMLGVRAQELEVRRREVIGSIAGSSTVKISDVAECLTGESRGRMLILAERLRRTLAEVQRENGVIRAATSSLLSHIDGLMQQVARALSRAGTYGRQGRVEGGPVACGLDMVH